MMTTLSSKYKPFGGLLLLIFINIMWATLTWQIIGKLKEKLQNPNYIWQGIDFGISGFVIFLQLLFLFLLTKECRVIRIEKDKITYINPLLPFIRRTVYFSDYDYKQTVLESSRGGYYEALWLIKNGKLKDRISSFYYANYADLKNSILIKNRGRLNMNAFRQLGCLFGMKI